MEKFSVKKSLRNKTRVIVVDDDPDMVDITVEFLEKLDIKVIGTGFDGKDAVTLFRKLHPDLVILDMKMPNYDGTYAIHNIISQDPLAKIIVLTGHADDYSFNDSEIASIIRKPFNIEQLIDAINLVMAKN